MAGDSTQLMSLYSCANLASLASFIFCAVCACVLDKGRVRESKIDRERARERESKRQRESEKIKRYRKIFKLDSQSS